MNSLGKLANARLAEASVLSLSLLDAFHSTKDSCQYRGYLLRFLSPLSVPSNRLIKMMSWLTITHRECVVAAFDQQRASTQQKILFCRRP